MKLYGSEFVISSHTCTFQHKDTFLLRVLDVCVRRKRSHIRLLINIGGLGSRIESCLSDNKATYTQAFA